MKRSRLKVYRPRDSRSPHPVTVRNTRNAANMTQKQASTLINQSVRAWQNWEVDPKNNEARQMPVSTWELFKIKLILKDLDMLELVEQVLNSK